MSYTPTIWHGGDVLSAEAMNKIEQGIADGGGVLLVEAEPDSNNSEEAILNKTYNEIKTAFLNGKSIIIFYYDATEACTSYEYIRYIMEYDDVYIIWSYSRNFYAENINDYPSTADPNAVEPE